MRPCSRPRAAACCAKAWASTAARWPWSPTSASGDHLGLNYITTVEDLAVLKRVIVQNVAPDGYAVLNAADPIVAAMAAGCPGNVIFFAADRTTR
jgi:UDP-N-acetylmuramyl pentapeptide synthase